MGKNKHYEGLNGVAGGMKVKSMIETVEQQMAEGMHVSAKASSAAEAENLQEVRKENAKSARKAKK